MHLSLLTGGHYVFLFLNIRNKIIYTLQAIELFSNKYYTVLCNQNIIHCYHFQLLTIHFYFLQMHVRVEQRRNLGLLLQPLGQILHSIRTSARQRTQPGTV